MVLIHEWLFVVLTCLGFAAAGAFAVLPFRSQFPYAPLLAPLFGIILVTLGAVTFYVLLQLSFQSAFMVSAACCLAASAWAAAAAWRTSGERPKLRALGFPLAVLAGVALIATAAATATASRYGGPALLFMDGTDHTFYAHTAAWLLNHSVSQIPYYGVTEPYTAWAVPTFLYDTSSGAYGFFAIISVLRGLPPLFAYDDGCAVVLTCGVLAVSAAFARRPLALLVLAAGLFTSHWFDYSRTGYLGKLLGYPSAFALAGVVIAALGRRLDTFRIVLLALLTMAAALTKFGAVTAYFLALLVGGFVVVRFLLEEPRRDWGRLREGGLLTGLLVALSLSGTGTLTRLESMPYPNWHLSWDFIFGRMLDLDNQGVGLSGLDQTSLIYLGVVALSITAALAVIAARRRDALALTLLVMPSLAIVGLFASGARAAAFQMIGTFHPLALCGAATLMGAPATGTTGPAGRAWRPLVPVLILAVIAVGLRAPRFLGALDRYVVNTPVLQRFTLADFDALAAAIGSEPVEVDLPGPTHTLAVLAELGRRGLSLQWGARSWQWMVSPPPHERPRSDRPATFRLRMIDEPVPADAVVALETRQFRLLRSR